MHSDTTGLWTPVAFSKDLPAGTAMPAYISSGCIALWRSGSGRVAASADRCPHRGMRLSHGFVRGEALCCIYHGWSYGQAGNCLRIPAHPGLVPPAAIRVAAYPVRECQGIIWVATGKPNGEPPQLEGLVPLRSLTANAGIGAIEAATTVRARPDGVVKFSHDLGPVFILLSAQEDGKTLMHVLLEAAADTALRLAASRAVEGLRRRAEELQAEGITR